MMDVQLSLRHPGNEALSDRHGISLSTSHAAWDVHAVHGVHAMYSVKNLGTASRSHARTCVVSRQHDSGEKWSGCSFTQR
jgi:hypothetical protein